MDGSRLKRTGLDSLRIFFTYHSSSTQQQHTAAEIYLFSKHRVGV